MGMMMQPHDVWQKIFAPCSLIAQEPFDATYPVTLADGRQIVLPIRPIADGHHALASLIINQASFAVLDALADDLAARLAGVDVVVGLPTLGLTLASEVARRLDHQRYVPLGTSRKFWYDDDLSVPLSSVTSPDQVKRLYIDPRMVPLLQGRKVALIDDVISSGRSIRAGLDVLSRIGVTPVAIGAAMLQSDRWRAAGEDWVSTVHGCFQTPILNRSACGGWVVNG